MVVSSTQRRTNNGCCLFKYHHGPINVRLSFPTHSIIYWFVSSVGSISSVVSTTCAIQEVSEAVSDVVIHDIIVVVTITVLHSNRSVFE